MDLGFYRAGVSILGVIFAKCEGLLDEFEDEFEWGWDEFVGCLHEFEQMLSEIERCSDDGVPKPFNVA